MHLCADALQILESLSRSHIYKACMLLLMHMVNIMYLFILWSRIGFGFESKKYSLEYVILVAEMIAALAEIYFPEVTNFPEGVFIFLYPREENIGYVTTPDVVEDSYDESSNKRSMYENLYLSEWTLCQGLYFMGYLEKAKAIGGRVFERQKNLHWEDTWQNSFSLKEEIQYVLSILGMTEEALLICKRLYTLHLRIYGDEHENTIHSMELLSRRLEEFGELVSYCFLC